MIESTLISAARLDVLLSEGRDAFVDVMRAGGFPSALEWHEISALQQDAHRAMVTTILRDIGLRVGPAQITHEQKDSAA